MSLPDALHDHLLNFNIDRYLNPWIPHNRLHLLPNFISRWFGYRSEPSDEPPTALQWPVTILATVGGLCLISSLNIFALGISEWHPPVIIASFGATAVLNFNAIKSPLSQPRNAVIGNTLAAISGVAISKLFQHNPHFNSIELVAGAVACAVASFVMSLTNTIHPPGGATAVLAATQSQVIALGWRYVPLILLDSILMVCVALLFNNILRQYPTYWWTPQEVGRKLRQQDRGESVAEEGLAKAEPMATSDTSSERTLHTSTSNRIHFVEDTDSVTITPYSIQMPSHVHLSEDEMTLLVSLQVRVRK